MTRPWRTATPTRSRRTPLILMANEKNESDGDIEFGRLESPTAGKFQNVAVDHLFPRHDSLCPPINAVRVYAQRTRDRGNPGGLRLGRAVGHSSADITARATAYLDRDIIGFRVPEKQALPFAPLALFSDRTVLGGLQAEDLDDPQFQAGLKSWEGQTVLPLVNPALGAGSDQWQYNKESKTFLKVDGQGVAPDGLPEMEVLLPLGFVAGKGDVPPNARMVKIGGKTVPWPAFWEVYAQHWDTGLVAEDLADFAGQLTLRADNQKRLRLPLSSMAALPAPESDELEMLLAAFVRLRDSAEARIWPLYTHVTEGADGNGTTDVSGFVAARIAHLEIVALPPDAKDAAKPYLRLVLQPAMLATPTAVTDFSKRLDFPQIENPYLAKVRLVE